MLLIRYCTDRHVTFLLRYGLLPYATSTAWWSSGYDCQGAAEGDHKLGGQPEHCPTVAKPNEKSCGDSNQSY